MHSLPILSAISVSVLCWLRLLELAIPPNRSISSSSTLWGVLRVSFGRTCFTHHIGNTRVFSCTRILFLVASMDEHTAGSIPNISADDAVNSRSSAVMVTMYFSLYRAIGVRWCLIISDTISLSFTVLIGSLVIPSDQLYAELAYSFSTTPIMNAVRLHGMKPNGSLISAS